MNRLTRLSVRNFCRKPFKLNLENAIVSFTFDDFPDSAFRNGATLLESFGATGTFYIAASLLGKNGPSGVHISRDELQNLRERNHHVGCHTYSHINVDSIAESELESEVQKNKDALEEILSEDEYPHFSYPFGKLSFSSKKKLSKFYDSMRGTHPAINKGEIDLAFLDSVALYENRFSKIEIDKWIERVVADKGWLIFYTHDVQVKPSNWGISINSFNYTLERVAASDALILNVKDAYDFITRKKEN